MDSSVHNSLIGFALGFTISWERAGWI